MIARVTFENESGVLFNPEEYGIFLVSFDAPAPTPKTYTVQIDGADGELDLSEWAGEVKYNTRKVDVAFRDMNGILPSPLSQFITGRKLKIYHSDEPDWYYYGRCVSVMESRRQRVDNQTFTFSCEPYKLAVHETIKTMTVTSSGTMALQAQRKTCIPTITVTAACTLGYDSNTYSVAAGTHTLSTFFVTEQPKTLTITGSTGITIKWRDGVL